MRACIFTSSHRCWVLLVLAWVALSTCPLLAQAAEGTSSAPKGGDRTLTPEDEDFSNTPFTEYGEFDGESSEESDLRFFQHGRYFGVSVGLGAQILDGNRSKLWQGGFPQVDLKVHYWFDLNFALDLNFYSASHFYDTAVESRGHVDVNFLHLGADFKYYVDTRNLSAAIASAGPYLVAGVGSYQKTELSSGKNSVSPDSSFGVAAGAGLEFAIKPKKIYFEVESKIHLMRFQDSSSSVFSTANDAADLSNNFYTFTGSLLFTW